MVQRAFPLLSEYPANRIEFLSPVTPETKLNDETGWSRILDEAWNAFESDAPARLKVQIADLPGHANQREFRPPNIISPHASLSQGLLRLYILT